MTLRASCCRGPLIRKCLSQHWLLFLGFLMIMFIQVKILFTEANTLHYWNLGIDNYVGGSLELFGAAVVSIFIFPYLHKKKQNSFYHSIPSTRNDLFLSSYFSGILFYAIPQVFITTTSVILFILEGFYFECIIGLIIASTYRFLMYVIFLTFASAGMILCGRTFFGLLTGLLLAVIIPMTEFMVITLVKPVLFGVSSDIDSIHSFLSPFYLMHPLIDDSTDLGIAFLKVLAYTLVSAILFLISLRLHRARKEEHVGQNLAFSQTLPVVQVYLTPVFVLICLLPITLITTKYSVYFIPLTIPVAFFLARMLILRSRKVFQKKAIFGCVGYIFLILALILCFQLDLFGINRRVPDADRVQQVSVSVIGVDFKSRDPEDIADVIAIHDRIIFHKDSLQKEQNDPYDDFITELRIDYTLNRNRTLSRTYYLSDLSHKASKEIIELAETYLCSGDHPQQQLEQIRQNAGDISFWTEDSYRIDLSTLQKQELFALLAEDLSDPDVDPMFLFTERDTENGLRIRFSLPEDPYLDHYIPREATATYAFLSKIAEETLGNN